MEAKTALHPQWARCSCRQRITETLPTFQHLCDTKRSAPRASSLCGRLVSTQSDLYALSQQIRPPIRPMSVLTTGRLSITLLPSCDVASPCAHMTLSAAVGCSLRWRERRAPVGAKRRFVHHSVDPIKERSTIPTERYCLQRHPTCRHTTALPFAALLSS